MPSGVVASAQVGTVAPRPGDGNCVCASAMVKEQVLSGSNPTPHTAEEDREYTRLHAANAELQAQVESGVAAQRLLEMQVSQAEVQLNHLKNTPLGLVAALKHEVDDQRQWWKPRLGRAIKRWRNRARLGRESREIVKFIEALGPANASVSGRDSDERVFSYLLGVADHVEGFSIFRDVEYVAMNLDVRSARSSPLVHFIKYGRKEGRNIHPLFDSEYYCKGHPEARVIEKSAAEHYEKWGDAMGYNPHPLFDVKEYSKRYPEVRGGGLSALAHYLAHPLNIAHWLFDGRFYLEQNRDVADAGINPFSHYLLYGWREGRNPHPMFDTAHYLSTYEDVRCSGVNPLVHYERHGGREGRKASEAFDPSFYVRAYADIDTSKVIPLRHYLEHGQREGRLATVPRRTSHDANAVARVRRALPVTPHRSVVFMIDASYPRPDRDSGSLDQLSFVKIFQQLGYSVHYAATTLFSMPHVGVFRDCIDGLRDKNVECITSAQYGSIEEYLFLNSENIAMVFVSRVGFGADYIAPARALCPLAKVVFYPVDLHYLREGRQAYVLDNAAMLSRAARTKVSEIEAVNAADATIVVSSFERDSLLQEGIKRPVFFVPLIREVDLGDVPGFSARHGIAFVGGFAHQPNVDAIECFLDQIWPKLHFMTPDITLRVIGADMPSHMLSRRIDGVTFVGYVADLSRELNSVKMTVAPLRYGAGAKGKIVSSLGRGVPCIGSSIAVEGMGLTPNEDIIVADGADMVLAILTLNSDEETWSRLSKNGRNFIQRFHSLESGVSTMREIAHTIALTSGSQPSIRSGRRSHE